MTAHKDMPSIYGYITMRHTNQWTYWRITLNLLYKYHFLIENYDRKHDCATFLPPRIAPTTHANAIPNRLTLILLFTLSNTRTLLFQCGERSSRVNLGCPLLFSGGGGGGGLFVQVVIELKEIKLLLSI